MDERRPVPIDTGRSEKLVHARYEDLLRAIGHYIDDNRFHDVVVTQVPDGVLLKGTVVERGKQGPVERIAAIFFTNDDIVALLEESARRRRHR